MGATLTVLGAIELLSGQTRAAREMYARAAERLAPVAAARRVAAVDGRRAVDRAWTTRSGPSRETARAAAIFDGTGCVIAVRRLAALRGPDWQALTVEIALSSR